MKRRAVIYVGMAVLVTGCSQKSEAPADYQYSISEDDPAETTNRNVYESLGDKTFNRVQKYKITGMTDAARKPHLLVVSVTTSVGKKVINRDVIGSVFMKDGSYTLECQHYYDVKTSVTDESIDDPSCKIELLGIMEMDAPAKVIKKS